MSLEILISWKTNFLVWKIKEDIQLYELEEVFKDITHSLCNERVPSSLLEDKVSGLQPSESAPLDEGPNYTQLCHSNSPLSFPQRREILYCAP